MSGEATVNPDGSTTFADSSAGANEEGFAGDSSSSSSFAEDAANNSTNMGGGEETLGGGEEVLVTKIDPALYLLAFAVMAIIAFALYMWRQRKSRGETEDFFAQLDGEKFNLKLPAAVDEYYEVKAKAEAQGWEPGQKAATGAAQATGPQRVLAQALMKRCIADVPLVTHIQNESGGMNKLYSQSMCSVGQWRSYQAAETMVSAEVEEVRAEADEIEPGWSQVIWRQAMQYHNMLKQRHEMEAKARAEQAEKKKLEENKVLAAKRKEDDEKAKILAAEKAAAELIMDEEKNEKKSKQSNGGMKKGFLTKKK